MDPQATKGIILSHQGQIKIDLNYKQIYEIRNLISDFLRKNITKQHQCIGLRMTHNIYIPSIVLSLQELQHAFIFLSDEDAETELIEKLRLVGILSFSSNKPHVIKLPLSHDMLILEKYPRRELKSYKNIFYVIRTSGTTGDSTFVKVGNYSIESNINSLTKIFGIQKTDVIYFGTPLTFDPSMIELLLALRNNACLLITSPKHKINPDSLYQTLFHPENGISVLQIVPSLFLRWSKQQIENILLNKNLRILAFGGECFPVRILSYKKSPTLRLFNLYGITEVSCWATVSEVTKVEDVSLGDALDDTIIEVRDDSGRTIQEGEGEIFIGSTKRICFVDDDESIFRATGDVASINKKGIFYKGRKNDVFKRFGHKLNLTKIEEKIQTEVNLPNVCVWSKEDSKLLTFLVLENFDSKLKDKILDKIRVRLLQTLPKEYFPDYFELIGKIPITTHGKINKKALEEIYLRRGQTNKKTASDVLKSLFFKYFGISEKIKDFQEMTFFELGGNSVLAIQFLSEFNDEIGTECPSLVNALFEKNLRACLDSISDIKFARKRLQLTNSHSVIPKKFKNDVELKIAWSHNLGACVDSTPLVFLHEGRQMVAVGSFSHNFLVLDCLSGEKIAKFILPDVIEASPCLSPCKNFLYVACFDGCLYCLDFMGNKIEWVYSTKDRVKCKPVLCKNSSAIVFGSYDKHVHCVNVTKGTPLWTTDVEESVTAAPLINQEKIYIGTICGSCFCLSETNGDIFWKFRTSSPIFGSPCLVDSTIIWPNVNGKLLFLTSEGHKVHDFDCGSHLYSSVVCYEKLVVFGCKNNNLYILKFDNGVKTHAISNLGGPLTTPCIDGDYIAVANNSGHLFLVDFEGEVRAELQLPADVFSSVAAHEGRLYVGCRDDNLYCVVSNK